MRLHTKDLGRIGKRTLMFVVPLVALFIVLFSFYEESIVQQTSQLLQIEQEKGNVVIANQLEATFSQYVSDLLTVFESAAFNRYIQDANSYNRDELEQLFLRIANKKTYINHIRFLDASGMETLKVDHYPDTLAVPSDHTLLKDRSDTQLFLLANTIGMDTLYISPIGLEIRQDFHDGHQGPALILAMPAYFDGEFSGLLILDYDACSFLSFLYDYQSSITKNINFGLLNNKGFWLKKDGKLCSEFLGSTEDTVSLFDEIPQLEQVIFSEDFSSHSIAGNAYSFHAVKPKTHQKLFWYPDVGRLWTVVSYYALAELPTLSLNPIVQHPTVKWWLASLFALSGFVIVLFLQLRRADQLQLQVSSIISEYSGNGIVVIYISQR